MLYRTSGATAGLQATRIRFMADEPWRNSDCIRYIECLGAAGRSGKKMDCASCPMKNNQGGKISVDNLQEADVWGSAKLLSEIFFGEI